MASVHDELNRVYASFPAICPKNKPTEETVAEYETAKKELYKVAKNKDKFDEFIQRIYNDRCGIRKKIDIRKAHEAMRSATKLACPHLKPDVATVQKAEEAQKEYIRLYQGRYNVPPKAAKDNISIAKAELCGEPVTKWEFPQIDSKLQKIEAKRLAKLDEMYKMRDDSSWLYRKPEKMPETRDDVIENVRKTCEEILATDFQKGRMAPYERDLGEAAKRRCESGKHLETTLKFWDMRNKSALRRDNRAMANALERNERRTLEQRRERMTEPFDKVPVYDVPLSSMNQDMPRLKIENVPPVKGKTKYGQMAWSQNQSCEKRNPTSQMKELAEKLAIDYIESVKQKAIERVNNVKLKKCEPSIGIGRIYETKPTKGYNFECADSRWSDSLHKGGCSWHGGRT